MSPLVKKEIRLLLPAWCIALVLAAVPTWLFDIVDHDPPLMSVSFAAAFGMVILVISAFGREFAHGTFSSMLAQPISRWRILLTKGGVLLVSVAAVVIVFWVSFLICREAIQPTEPDWWAWLFQFKWGEQQLMLKLLLWQLFSIGVGGAVVIIAGGLWTTLVFRQMMAAFWATILIPGWIILSAIWLGAALNIQDTDIFLLSALAGYSLFGILWTGWLFRRMEDVPPLWGSRELPSLGELLGTGPASAKQGVRHPLSALFWQEFSLHRGNQLCAGGLLVFILACIGIRASEMLPPASKVHDLLQPVGVLWLLMPLLCGASAIAEERRLGTLEGRLCLPVSRRIQFLYKFGVASVLGIVLGAGALVVTEALARALGVSGILVGEPSSLVLVESALGLTGACLALTFIGFYASSLARNALQAIGIAVALALVALLSLDWAGRRNLFWIAWLHLSILPAAWVWLSYGNLGHLQCDARRVRVNILTTMIPLLFAGALSEGIYFRAWEFLGPCEPAHGPARISTHGETKITGDDIGTRLLILLPDRRLWVSSAFNEHPVGDYTIQTPARGTFMPGANWVDVAYSYAGSIALQSDGSLWSIGWQATRTGAGALVEQEIQQIGNETNWTAIAAGTSHLLALKSDGTLWGWGSNRSGQVCVGPKEITEPAQIGEDADWVAVFARRSSSIAVKRDGTAWQWGRLRDPLPDRNMAVYRVTFEPVRWEADLRHVKTLIDCVWFDLLLHDDGSLWAAGQHYWGVLGTPLETQYTSQPIRVGDDQLWRDADSTRQGSVGIREDGSLWKDLHSEGGRTVRPASKYSDWIAIESPSHQDMLYALAADGTLVCWTQTDGWNTPLTPTRRPIASLNIFDAAE